MRAFLDRHYGWVMVAIASTCGAFAFGAQIGISIFLAPIADEFGWARGDVSLAYSSAAFMAGLGGVIMGFMLDRFSIRPIVIMGAVAMGLSQVLMSQIGAQWQLYAINGLVLGGLAMSAFMAPMVVSVSFWFDKNRGLALGLTMAGQAVGASIVPNVLRWLEAEQGWRDAYFTWGLVCWAVVLPLTLMIRTAPAARAASEARASGKTETPGFHPPAQISPKVLVPVLGAAIVCCCICMSIPLVHLVTMAVEYGMDKTVAASVLGTAMLAAIVGRIGVGQLADRIGGVRALLVASGGQTAFIFWFTQLEGLPLYLNAIGYGVTYGGVVPAYAIILREYVSPLLVGRSTGIVFFFGNLGMALGGYIGGVLFDLSGRYEWSFAAGAMGGIVNLMIVSTLYTWLRGRRLPVPVAEPQPV